MVSPIVALRPNRIEVRHLTSTLGGRPPTNQLEPLAVAQSKVANACAWHVIPHCPLQ
jgi:hypothetical protein